MSAQEQSLHSALVELHGTLADEVLPKGSFVSPQALMSTKLLDHIVGLVHEQKLCSLEALCQQVSGWAFLDSHGSHIFSLIQQFCPPPSSSLFSTVPLQRQLNNSENTVSSSSLAHPQHNNSSCKPCKCGICGGEKHDSELQYSS